MASRVSRLIISSPSAVIAASRCEAAAASGQPIALKLGTAEAANCSCRADIEAARLKALGYMTPDGSQSERTKARLAAAANVFDCALKLHLM